MNSPRGRRSGDCCSRSTRPAQVERGASGREPEALLIRRDGESGGDRLVVADPGAADDARSRRRRRCGHPRTRGRRSRLPDRCARAHRRKLPRRPRRLRRSRRRGRWWPRRRRARPVRYRHPPRCAPSDAPSRHARRDLDHSRAYGTAASRPGRSRCRRSSYPRFLPCSGVLRIYQQPRHGRIHSRDGCRERGGFRFASRRGSPRNRSSSRDPQGGSTSANARSGDR